MKPINVAVVGLLQGLEDVYTILNQPRYNLVCLCDSDTRPWAWLTGARNVADEPPGSAVFSHHRRWIADIHSDPRFSQVAFTASFQEVLDDPDIDAVVLVLPDRLHSAFAVRALDAGKFVLATKPMALTIGGAFAIAEAAQRHPNHFMLGYQLTYGWFAQTILRLIDSGQIGTPRLLRFDFHRGPWRPTHRKKYAPIDGAMVKEGGHWLDLFYRLSGQQPWQTMTGTGGRDKPADHDFEFEDNGSLLIDYGSFRVSHNFSYFRQPRGRSESFMLVGEEGSVQGSFASLTVEDDAGEETLIAPEKKLPHQFHEGYYEMHEAFAAMVQEDQEPYTDWRTGLESVFDGYAAEIAVSECRSVRRTELIALDWQHQTVQQTFSH